MGYRLHLLTPAGDAPVIDHRRHFAVDGRIEGGPLPDETVCTVTLTDAAGRTVRTVRQPHKGPRPLHAYHPLLTAYDEADDPRRERLRVFGFAELTVRDEENADASLRDATVKCFFDDTRFKAIIVCATDRAHGLLLDDGIGYTDGCGKPYTALPCGRYTLTVTLSLPCGQMLAGACKAVRIGTRSAQAIYRFYPPAHREAMAAWCREMGIVSCDDAMPGYLPAYLHPRPDHMGLLPMYRACDVAMYNVPCVHMFIYLIDPDSTSYATELAYLRGRGAVGDAARFRTYRYDIGEAMLGQRRGRVVDFNEGLALYRLDTVTDAARENIFDIGGGQLLSTQCDADAFGAAVGQRVAFCGAVRPWPIDKARITLLEDNTYRTEGEVCALRYTFDDGQSQQIVTRSLLMQRTQNGVPLGRSVFEFYNLFDIPAAWAGKTVCLRIEACDENGPRPDASFEAALHIYR